MPADPGYVAYNQDRYQSGVRLPNSGHLRVTVSPEQVTVDYVRCYLPQDETERRKTGEVAHSYAIKSKGSQPKTLMSYIAYVAPVPCPDPARRRVRQTRQFARGHRGQGATNYFNVAVPAHAYDLILARPEKNAITLSVLAYLDMEGSVAYGVQSGTCTTPTPVRQFKQGAPVELVLGGLEANTPVLLSISFARASAEPFTNSPEYTFHTARPPGSSFTFTLTGDAHLDERTSPGVYRQTLANIRADNPDFHIDLGNLFMTDKHASREEAGRQYLAQRYYLGQMGCSTPILLALGPMMARAPSMMTVRATASRSGRTRCASATSPTSTRRFLYREHPA